MKTKRFKLAVCFLGAILCWRAGVTVAFAQQKLAEAEVTRAQCEDLAEMETLDDLGAFQRCVKLYSKRQKELKQLEINEKRHLESIQLMESISGKPKPTKP